MLPIEIPYIPLCIGKWIVDDPSNDSSKVSIHDLIKMGKRLVLCFVLDKLNIFKMNPKITAEKHQSQI